MGVRTARFRLFIKVNVFILSVSLVYKSFVGDYLSQSSFSVRQDVSLLIIQSLFIIIIHPFVNIFNFVSQFSTNNQMKTFRTKFHKKTDNKWIFWRKKIRVGHKTLFIRKLKLFTKIKDFDISSLILLEPACENSNIIEKWEHCFAACQNVFASDCAFPWPKTLAKISEF